MPVPVFCYFCISGFPAIKSAPKISEKLYKKSASRKALESPKEGRGPPQGLQKGPWRGPTLGRAREPPGCPVAPLGAPLRLYLPPEEETPNIDLLFANSSLYRCTAISRSGLPGEAALAPCRKEEPPPGDHPSPWTPPECAVSSPPLDHGSMTSSYVMYSSPLCASTFGTS